MIGDPPPRVAARVLLLDRQDRLLLLRVVDPADGRAFWETPGGGIAGGESPEACALRELREETGIDDAVLGPCVWIRRFRFRFAGRTVDQRERFFLARARSTAVSGSGRTPLEARVFAEHRWWTVRDVAGSPEAFAPTGLAGLLAPLVAGVIPAEPRVLDAPPAAQT